MWKPRGIRVRPKTARVSSDAHKKYKYNVLFHFARTLPYIFLPLPRELWKRQLAIPGARVRFVGTVPDNSGLVFPSFRPKSGSKSKIPGRILKSCRGPFSSAEEYRGHPGTARTEPGSASWPRSASASWRRRLALRPPFTSLLVSARTTALGVNYW